MPNETFARLPPERKEELLAACLEEFSEHGYDAASTNRIVQRLGISKGLLFKYFGSKEALFLHLFEAVLIEVSALQGSSATYHSTDLFERLDELFEAALGYAREQPLRYRFSLRASIDTHSAVFEAAEALRQRIAAESIHALFDGVDWELYRLPREEVLEIFRWLLGGSRQAAVTSLQQGFTLESYETLMRTQLHLIRKLLAGGIYRAKEKKA